MVSSAGGILEQYEVKAVPEGKGSWSGVPLIHTPKKLAPNVQREELCLCLQRIAFQKQCLWFAVTSIYLLCPHMQKIIHPPTKVNICKYKYILVDRVLHATVTATSANEDDNSSPCPPSPYVSFTT